MATSATSRPPCGASAIGWPPICISSGSKTPAYLGRPVMIDYISARPLEPVSLAKDTARANLADRLVSTFNLSPRYAELISRAVVDPTAVRHQIDNPQIKRFPDG